MLPLNIIDGESNDTVTFDLEYRPGVRVGVGGPKVGHNGKR